MTSTPPNVKGVIRGAAIAGMLFAAAMLLLTAGGLAAGLRLFDRAGVDAAPAGTQPAGPFRFDPASGNSDQLFAVGPSPLPATCPGDSAKDGFRVDSFMTPVSNDPATLTYNAAGPVGAGLTVPLFDRFGTPIIAKNTAPDTGLILSIPSINFSVFGPGGIPAGKYFIGIACSKLGVTESFWASTIEVTLDATNGGTSEVQVALVDETDTTTTTTVPATTTTIGGTTTTVPATTTTIGGTTTTVPATTTTIPATTTTVPPATTTVPPATTTPGGTTTTAPGNASGVRGGFTVVKPSGPCIAVRNVAVSFGELLAGSTDAAAGDTTTVVSSCTNQSLRVGVNASDAVSPAPAAASLAVRRCAVSPPSPSLLQCGSRIGSKEFGYASAESANGSAFDGTRPRLFDLAPAASLTYQHYVQGPGSGAPAQQFEFVITYTATAK